VAHILLFYPNTQWRRPFQTIHESNKSLSGYTGRTEEERIVVLMSSCSNEVVPMSYCTWKVMHLILAKQGLPLAYCWKENWKTINCNC